MNTNNINKYAPKARVEFMAVIAKRSRQFGDLLVDVKGVTGKK